MAEKEGLGTEEELVGRLKPEWNKQNALNSSHGWALVESHLGSMLRSEDSLVEL